MMRWREEDGEAIRGLPNRRSNMKRTPRHDYLLPPPSPILSMTRSDVRPMLALQRLRSKSIE